MKSLVLFFAGALLLLATVLASCSSNAKGCDEGAYCVFGGQCDYPNHAAGGDCGSDHECCQSGRPPYADAPREAGSVDSATTDGSAADGSSAADGAMAADATTSPRDAAGD